MTTGSIFGYVVLAVIGAFVVLCGLLMEQYSEQRLPKNIKDFRWCKIIKLCGEWFVIGGVFIEFAVGIISAIDAWQNESLNRPVSEISAFVRIRVKGTNDVEVTQQTDELSKLDHLSAVAGLNLCSGLIRLPSLSGGTFLEPVDSGFPMLESDRFEVSQWFQFIQIGRAHV